MKKMLEVQEKLKNLREKFKKSVLFYLNGSQISSDFVNVHNKIKEMAPFKCFLSA